MGGAVSLLEVEGLDQFYGDFQALFEVSLHVEPGEILAIIGANGAGKSTLLRTIAGLQTSPADSLRFDGEPIGDRPAFRRVRAGISLVPEGRRIFPGLSVRENLQVGAWSRRDGSWTLDRVLGIFPLLARIASRPAAVLSGGEQQALAIGRGLMANPRLLLLDEISLGLAPIAVKQLYGAIPAISSEGTTLMIVEQDVTQAMAIAGRAYCFLEGRVSLHGDPRELTREQVTAAYFGI
jgi:branched-chain amino acid transport system ATP-binding protein